MTFTPPNKILRTSDETELEYNGLIKTNPIQYTYKYLNGILKGLTVNYQEDEIKKQLKNYWKEIK